MWQFKPPSENSIDSRPRGLFSTLINSIHFFKKRHCIPPIQNANFICKHLIYYDVNYIFVAVD